ncbi:isocitrate lyase/phosphoenolpyruvate mutase family protein [Sphingomonas sp. So64.6b]|uniref:isocitrate lyase/PEP mutase family protein n=1 Tax=Sphingomonas sp. So64.6b TaxID=2997354 RepID=UPI0016013F69|nr:isocitrate lyase/phosphoenolpyruvate mutase family protein [Sphingomonas sp. So64.6b]QNA82601.1 isocitrate lyase/phosphoenolpyruvate mutase family protein [Sphingomonas sp. So64.6b]
MPNRREEAACTFKSLHMAPGGFIMPNAWDAGSAAILAATGFPAIATTSAGIAFALAKADYGVTSAVQTVSREEMFAHIREIVQVAKIPVNADLEAGYGDSPRAVAETIIMAIEAGLAGGNIEDKIPGRPELYDEALAIERIAAARSAIDACGSDFMLTARSDTILQSGKSGIAAGIRRSNRYREAGADCLYLPGAADIDLVAVLTREIAGPINVVMGLGTASGNAHALLAAGVQRISLGGSIARAALGFVRRCAEELRDHGTIGFAEQQIPQSDLNALFAQVRGGTKS